MTLYLDLSGDSLHKRGYRSRGHAPLKENLAAAILIKSKWPSIGAKGGGFIDPMCGSATLPIEAAMIAGDIALAFSAGTSVSWAGKDTILKPGNH